MPALRLRLRTTCATCGHPIPLTSAILPVACPTCDAIATLGAGSFGWVVQDGMSPRSSSEGDAIVGDAAPAGVTCNGCQAPIDEATLERGFAAGGITCRCGRDVHVRAVPVAADGTAWWSAFVGESTHEKPAPTAEPVHFACPNCGGALLVDGQTRTPPCRHCGTRAYLPDDLWRALRPTPRVEPFYLWVDAAWENQWTTKRRAALKWAIVACVAIWGGLVVGGLVTGIDDIAGPAVGAGWIPATIAGMLLYRALTPKRTG